MSEATDVLNRFAPQLRWVVEHLRDKFNLQDHEIDDLKQEARLQILCYAGLIAWPTKQGRHKGILVEWKNKTEGVESEIKSLLAYELRLDLTRIITSGSKQLLIDDRSIDELMESDQEPSEPSHETESDNNMDETQYLRRYPEFAMSVLDGLSQDEIAARQGITDRTVRNRIAGQKRSFLSTQLRKRGIVVEGDETMDELEEAYGYARVVR